jgi:hypothetical protein
MDIRLIKIANGEVELDGSMMNVPLSPIEESIQRIVLCLMNTIGTMLENPGWGGNAQKMLNRNRGRDQDSRQAYTEVISNTLSSMLPNEPPFSPYRVIDLSIVDVVSTDRGARCIVKVSFAEATSLTVSLPNVSR